MGKNGAAQCVFPNLLFCQIPQPDSNQRPAAQQRGGRPDSANGLVFCDGTDNVAFFLGCVAEPGNQCAFTTPRISLDDQQLLCILMDKPIEPVFQIVPRFSKLIIAVHFPVFLRHKQVFQAHFFVFRLVLIVKKERLLKALGKLVAVVVDLIIVNDPANVVPKPDIDPNPIPAQRSDLLLHSRVCIQRGGNNIGVKKRAALFLKMGSGRLEILRNGIHQRFGVPIVLALDQRLPVVRKDIDPMLLLPRPAEQMKLLPELHRRAVPDQPLKLLPFRRILFLIFVIHKRSDIHAPHLLRAVSPVFLILYHIHPRLKRRNPPPPLDKSRPRCYTVPNTQTWRRRSEPPPEPPGKPGRARPLQRG